MASFPDFNVTDSVYVCIRKSTDEARAHITVWNQFRYNTENLPQNIHGYTDIFTVYCFSRRSGFHRSLCQKEASAKRRSAPDVVDDD